VICTGRGFAVDGNADGGGLLRRGRGWAGLEMMLSFLVLEFFPRAEKKPPVTLEPAESGETCDVCDPITVVEGGTPASAG